jgi:hypothetical protein
MKYLLFGGAPNVGKSGAVYRTANYLISKGYKVIDGSIPATFTSPPSPPEFFAILEGVNQKGKTTRIAVNSGTDSAPKVKEFKTFLDKALNHIGQIDIIITSIRDDFEPANPKNERNMMKKILGIVAADFLLEIPLGKVRGGSGRPNALVWYEGTVDTLTQYVLDKYPFFV